MRILHILNSLENSGNGIVNVTVDLACQQVKQGHQVGVIAKGGGYASLLEKQGILLYPLDQSRSVRALMPALRQLKHIFREFRPDVVHAHMRAGLLFAWLCTRFTNIRLATHLHNIHDRHYGLVRLADVVIAVSKAVQSTLVLQGVSAKKVRVVVNGPLGSPRRAAFDSLIMRKLHHPSIVTVAGMNSRKGIAELIEAFCIVAEETPQIHLYLVGQGPEKARFEALASQSRFADQIHFEGHQNEPGEYMLATDIFVLASRRESMPLVLMEAREAGCAIIATAVDGIPEALDHGAAGLVIPPQNPALLAASIKRLLLDDDMRRTYQRRAREGSEAFSCKRVAEEVELVYREIVSKDSRFHADRGALPVNFDDNNMVGDQNR